MPNRQRKGIWNRVNRHLNHFIFGVGAIIGGLYVWFHQGYLDDPRVTPPPPPPHFEQVFFGFADDWWFALLLISSGTAILVGILFCRRGLRDWGMVALSPALGSLTVAFMVRDLLDGRFNLTWVFALITFALLIGTLMRGDRHES